MLYYIIYGFDQIKLKSERPELKNILFLNEKKEKKIDSFILQKTYTLKMQKITFFIFITHVK